MADMRNDTVGSLNAFVLGNCRIERSNAMQHISLSEYQQAESSIQQCSISANQQISWQKTRLSEYQYYSYPDFLICFYLSSLTLKTHPSQLITSTYILHHGTEVPTP
jgi:hypothetical protein